MFKLCVAAIVLAVAAMASVDGMAVYRYNYPSYNPYYGLGGVIPVVGSGVESRKVEGKVEGATPISSYLIDPLYASYYHGYPYAGYPYTGYPYGPALRFIRDADKNVEQVDADKKLEQIRHKVEEPAV